MSVSCPEPDAPDEIEKATVVSKGREPGVYVQVNEPARALVEGPLHQLEGPLGLAESKVDDCEVIGRNVTAPREIPEHPTRASRVSGEGTRVSERRDRICRIRGPRRRLLQLIDRLGQHALLFVGQSAKERRPKVIRDDRLRR